MPSPLQDLADQLIRRDTALEVGRSSHSRSELAMMLAGTSDKKSKPYKAALRNLERYEAAAGKERRKASPQTLDKLAGELRKDDKAMEAAIEREPEDIYVVNYNGEICISEDCRLRHATYRVSKQELLNAARAPNEEQQGLRLIYPYVEADSISGTFSIRRS